MKIGLLIFLGILVLQSKWHAYHNLTLIGVCWGGNPVPLSRKARPFLISTIISLMLEALFTGILIGFSPKVLTAMWLVEIAADILFAIGFWIACLYWRIRNYFYDSKQGGNNYDELY